MVTSYFFWDTFNRFNVHTGQQLIRGCTESVRKRKSPLEVEQSTPVIFTWQLNTAGCAWSNMARTAASGNLNLHTNHNGVKCENIKKSSCHNTREVCMSVCLSAAGGKFHLQNTLVRISPSKHACFWVLQTGVFLRVLNLQNVVFIRGSFPEMTCVT